MTWGNRARQRADDFDALVERSSTGGVHDRAGPRDAELLELVGALRATPDPQPRPEFVADLRGRLMAEAETALVPTDVSKLRLPARRTTRERRLAAVVGGLVIAGTTTSVAVASQSALPGESLYPIKRVLESAHAGLSLGEARKGDIELSNAASRLDEATKLARSSDAGDALRIAPTLDAFTDQATSGADLLFADYARDGDEDSIVTLHDFAASSLDQLEDLEPNVPDDARDELLAAADIVAQIDAEASQQCPDCAGPRTGDFPASLLSAPAVELPAVPPVQQDAAATSRGDGAGTKHHGTRGGHQGGAPGQGDAGQGGSELPTVDGALPPGSVVDPGQPASPGATPSGAAKPNPVKTLTDGLTGVLTGQGATGGSGGSGTSPGSGGTGTTPGSSPSATPLGQVVDGVGGILQGVLDPITGLLLPPQQ